MDPDVVASAEFDQLFVTTLPGNYNGNQEQVFSQPLVYTTPADGVQYVYLATTQNNVYKINAKTGQIVLSRNLHIPFQQADLDGCPDIEPFIGVTSTGVIDPDTDTLYLTAKTYQLQNNGTQRQGLYNGRYYLHAINVNDLTERANFPVPLEGTIATNNPVRMFNGGIHHQRPALLHTGNFIYAGFASHCVQYNFTGWIMGWDKTTGDFVERFATEGDGVPNTIKGGGVWMSGGGLASDDQGSLFFATGNGYASQLADIPVNGRTPPTSLEEAAVHMSIADDGSLSIVDFFMPQEKQVLDGNDWDLGTSPLEILPSSVFSCGDITRMGVVTGKSGKTYFLNLDNLGGYRMGPASSDAVIQIYQNENSVYAGAGVYPGEGGYIYINVINYPTHVFKFSCDSGVPSFTKVADSPVKNAAILGVGHGTVTSLNGEPGTGLVWINDRQGPTLRIYNAVPVNGLLTLVKEFQAKGAMIKFTRPVFGDGIVYHSTQGFLYAYGAPINPALNCTTPSNFGSNELETTTTPVSITCSAKIAVTVSGAAVNDGVNFELSNLPAFPLKLSTGATFTFSAAFHPTSVGNYDSAIILNTTNGVAGYSTETSVRLSGAGVTSKPLLAISPASVVFNQVVAGNASNEQPAILLNQGNSALTISSFQFSNSSLSGPFTKVSNGSSTVQFGQFTFSDLPSVIANNSQEIMSITFSPVDSGNFSAYVVINSDGGSQNLTVTASAGPAPVAVIEFQTPDGTGWVPFDSDTPFTFGNVTENQTRSLKLRLTNAAPPDGVALSITVSKLPFGVPGIIQTANNVDLVEGVSIPAGQSATATIFCSPPKSQWNVDPYQATANWTMNTNDPTWGKHFMEFMCEGVAEQAPPLLADGEAVYRYVGCFKENNPNRQLATQLFSDSNMTIAECVAACAAANYAYCGTQYQRECWAGPVIPNLQVDEGDCNFFCAGSLNQICGGNGVGNGTGGAYISLYYNPAGTNPGTGNNGGGNSGGVVPILNETVGNWTYEACYTESTTGRALSGNSYTFDNMTLVMCASFCQGFSYFGTEYSKECYCGNELGAGSVNTTQSDCSFSCGGNPYELCGGSSRLSVYSTNDTTPPPQTPPSGSPWEVITSHGQSYCYYGCQTEGNSTRALTAAFAANDSMTLEYCANFCAGYTYFGAEYSRECYCGNSFSVGSVSALKTDCSDLCMGNTTETCGGSQRLSVYFLNSTDQASPSSTASSSPSSSSTLLLNSAASSSPPSSTSTTTTTSSTPSATIILSPSNNTYISQGCWAEPAQGRALSDDSMAEDSLTVEACAAFCDGYQYFGAEYGRECYCGDVLNGTAAAARDCSFPCAGNATELCGAGLRLSLYEAHGTAQLRFPKVISSQGATYMYYGCYTEATESRALSDATYVNDTLTLQTCATFCSGHAFFGAEYAQECYCGDVLNAGSVPAPDQTDCSLQCAGDAEEKCGAGSRLSVYELVN